MSEKSEQFTSENEVMNNSLTDPASHSIKEKELPTTEATQRLQIWQERHKSKRLMAFSSDSDITVIEASEKASTDEEQKLLVVEKQDMSPEVEMPLAPPSMIQPKKTRGKKPKPTAFNKRDVANVHMLQERCRHLCLSLFYREHAPIRSLGITSSIAREGKSLIAAVTAQVLAHDSSEPVTLVECNWEHPSLHEYFGIPATPGLAEWLRGTCKEDDIRYQVDDNLTVIPAGNGSQDAVKLLKQIQQHGWLNTFARARDVYLVDLPPIITSGYGSLAASLLESLVIVVRAQVIPESMVAETCSQLKDLPVFGIILNQSESRIPRWLRQLM
jgi:Mrp family chromosome partitioning ATPase